MKPLLASLLICILLLSYSCEKQYAFSQNNTIPETGWTYDNILKYEFDVPDTAALYDLYLEVNYMTSSFSYQNIYVSAYTGQDVTDMKKTQLSLDLSNKLGVWKGECNSEECTYLLPLQKSIFFENTGKQYFWLEQFSRDENLKGIQSIRLVGDKIGSRS